MAALKSSRAVAFLAWRGRLFQSLTVRGNSDCLRGRPQAPVRERMGRYSWRFPARVFLLAGVGSRDGSTATRPVLILNTSVHLADLWRDSRLGHSKSSISPPTSYTNVVVVTVREVVLMAFLGVSGNKASGLALHALEFLAGIGLVGRVPYGGSVFKARAHY